MTIENPLIVTTATDEVDPNDGLVSLREAIAYANSHTGDDTITFDPSLAGQTITLTLGPLELTDTTGVATITGLGANQLTIDGDHSFQTFYIDSGVTASISGLTLADGDAANSSGGTIWNQGSLSISDCIVAGNSATEWGGAINNWIGSMTSTNCTVSGNRASGAGGIFNNATLLIRNSTISGNTASNDGGGIYNGARLHADDHRQHPLREFGDNVRWRWSL